MYLKEGVPFMHRDKSVVPDAAEFPKYLCGNETLPAAFTPGAQFLEIPLQYVSASVPPYS